MTRRQYVCFDKKEGSIYLPNEIFSDFKEAFTKRNQASFAYSYYYLINYLYRYNKYIVNVFTQKILKEFLGYRETNKAVNVIIKENGLLDSIGYTKTVSDYPVFVELDENNSPQFQMKNETKESYPELSFLNDKSYRIKYPIKAFYRNEFGLNNQYKNGTYYEIEGTHGIEVERFISMMDDDEIGIIGFYIYGYLKNKIGFNYKHYFAQSHDEIADALNMSHATVVKYTKLLEERGLISVTHQDFWRNTEGQANIYKLC